MHFVVHCNEAQQGTLVEGQQDTPVSAKQREVAYVPFGVDVELSTPLEEIPQGKRIDIIVLLLLLLPCGERGWLLKVGGGSGWNL